MENEHKTVTAEDVLERIFDFSTDNNENLELYMQLEGPEKLKVLTGVIDRFNEEQRSSIFRDGVIWFTT